jgi:cold shock protein
MALIHSSQCDEGTFFPTGIFHVKAEALPAPIAAALLSSCEVPMQGTVKRVIRDRGFGFIKSTEGREIFFHRSSLQGLDFDTLKEGDAVEFEIEDGPKGPRAALVRSSSE